MVEGLRAQGFRVWGLVDLGFSASIGGLGLGPLKGLGFGPLKGLGFGPLQGL